MDKNFLSKMDPLLVSLIRARGANTPEEICAFINGNQGVFHSPSLMIGMDEAVIRINRALSSNEKILIIGDSDSDGITATAILYDYLQKKGAIVSFIIPANGTSSVALNEDQLISFEEQGITLVVTVDMGISVGDFIGDSKKHGIDIIITDHHETKEELPGCYAVIDPKRKGSTYPFSGLSGAGVALKLICALEKDCEKILKEYCDLVAIGTIADAMPLLDENRNIVRMGLSKINSRMRPSISALLKTAGYNSERPVTASVLGFVVAPRLNAAGRVDNAHLAVELLLCNDGERVKTLANLFAEANRERQQIELVAINEAAQLIEKEVDLDVDKIIILKVNDWQQGIAGIVASRIVDRYSLPCIIVSFAQGVGRGSARSVKGFNLFTALGNNKQLLMEYGGHELAAGITVTLDKFDELKENLKKEAALVYEHTGFSLAIKEEARIDEEKINMSFAQSLSVLEPFGNENPQPIFLAKNMHIDDIISLANDRHLKFSLSKNGKRYTALYFGRTLREIKCTAGDIVDIYFAMDINTFKKKTQLQLILKKVELSPECLIPAYNDEYEQYISGKTESLPKEAIPDKDDVISVYRYLMRIHSENWKSSMMNPMMMARHISRNFSSNMNFAKLLLSMEILSQLGLVEYERKGSYICARAMGTQGKINLSESVLWKKLRG